LKKLFKLFLLKDLEEMHKNHPCHAPRIRAHAILLTKVSELK